MWWEIQHRFSCRVRTWWNVHLLQSGKAESDRNEIACANKCANSASACCQSWTQQQTSVLSCGKWPCRTWKSIFLSLTLWLASSLCMTTLKKIVGSDIGPRPCAEIALGTSRGWMTKLLLWMLSSRCLGCKVGYTSLGCTSTGTGFATWSCVCHLSHIWQLFSLVCFYAKFLARETRARHNAWKFKRLYSVLTVAKAFYCLISLICIFWMILATRHLFCIVRWTLAFLFSILALYLACLLFRLLSSLSWEVAAV